MCSWIASSVVQIVSNELCKLDGQQANPCCYASRIPCCAIMVVHKYVTLSWRCCVEFMAGVRHVKKSMIWWIQCKYSGLVISSPKCPWSVGVQCKWTPVQIKSINSLLRISSSFRIPKFANSKISEFANVQMQMTSLAWLGKPSYPNLTLSMAMHPRIQYLAKSSCCQWNSFLALLILVLMCLLLPKSMDLESWTQLRRIW